MKSFTGTRMIWIFPSLISVFPIPPQSVSCSNKNSPCITVTRHTVFIPSCLLRLYIRGPEVGKECDIACDLLLRIQARLQGVALVHITQSDKEPDKIINKHIEKNDMSLHA